MLTAPMYKKILCVIGIIVLVIGQKSNAQDIQFSQYYAAPLYLNPALAGINQIGRAGINYRNQWFGIPDGKVTFLRLLNTISG